MPRRSEVCRPYFGERDFLMSRLSLRIGMRGVVLHQFSKHDENSWSPGNENVLYYDPARTSLPLHDVGNETMFLCLGFLVLHAIRF